MLIGILSDTHDNIRAADEAVRLFNQMGVSVVIHAGDWCAPFTLLRFKGCKAKVRGALGNNDGEQLGLLETAEKLGFELGHLIDFMAGPIRVAVLHGTDERIVRALAKSGEYGLVVRGHTHETGYEKIGDCLIVNPGEACGYLTGKRTVAILDADAMKVTFHELEVATPHIV
ncbi:metallophosphoesterase [Candidatus Bathyarchaeota archaeon]|nr:metallophosphoesterase [Candidatus Bathyarchaeota archaeon]MBS7627942.1 metallophosphoesterase [Candidatus Bathyarchaeota archaeon]